MITLILVAICLWVALRGPWQDAADHAFWRSIGVED